MEKLRVEATGTERLRGYLEKHGGVALASFGEGPLEIRFDRGDWPRRCLAGVPEVGGPYGLCELMDNNPLVCADEASCPGPAATLALIAFGPLIRAGILVGRPSCKIWDASGLEEVPAALASEGRTGEVEVESLEGDGRVAKCFAAAQVSDAGGVAGLFEECFGRSFFVRMGDLRVEGEAFACYSLEINGQEVRCTVTADPDGKCGAAQVVHMFNVMAGFEEDLGLSG